MFCVMCKGGGFLPYRKPLWAEILQDTDHESQSGSYRVNYIILQRCLGCQGKGEYDE